MDAELKEEILEVVGRLDEAGETDAAAKLRLVLEYEDNPAFHAWLENTVYVANNGE